VNRGRNGEPTEHRDQLLCALAENKVPLNAVIRNGEETILAKDLLRTSVREFHLDQEEIEWTATAFALYLPPQACWANRLGETFTFDDLATTLMSRSPGQGSCRGIHLATSLTVLLLADARSPVLSQVVRDKTHRFLSGLVEEASETQLADGGWPQCWAPSLFLDDPDYGFTPASNLVNRVIVAGHLTEWFHLLPEELKPRRETVHRATANLCGLLEQSPEQTMRQEFCPYSHAVFSLFLAKQ
ncbi:MAG: hypothetical protein AAF989_12695, partial [Planctomycetota bacterium]